MAPIPPGKRGRERGINMQKDSRFSLTVDGAEVSRHITMKLACEKAKSLLRNPNQIATIQDLYPTGAPGRRVCIVWRWGWGVDGAWSEYRHHVIPGEKARAKASSKASSKAKARPRPKAKAKASSKAPKKKAVSKIRKKKSRARAKPSRKS